MLKIHDIRESRVYQEAREEGIAEERERSQQDKLAATGKLAARLRHPDIADVLNLDLDFVK